ncbi:hypothetical protein GCM10027075_27610 [Streptomyces heilongjiangensis]
MSPDTDGSATACGAAPVRGCERSLGQGTSVGGRAIGAIKVIKAISAGRSTRCGCFRRFGRSGDVARAPGLPATATRLTGRRLPVSRVARPPMAGGSDPMRRRARQPA